MAIDGRNRGIICILLMVILGILLWRSNIVHNIEAMENPPMIGNMKYQSYVINMDKDTERYTKVGKYYEHSDLSSSPLIRYPAVVGRDVVANKWLTDDALSDLHHIVTNGYRTHHHQLTPGGIGCFLSHYNLAKQLVSDKSNVDAYIVFEDDTAIPKNISAHLQSYYKKVPDDWDYIMLYTIRSTGASENEKINKLKSFWGMNGYVMNRKGAQKLVDETNTSKIDGQIDSYLSRMIQQDKMNIYATKKHLITSNSQDTNIQMILKPIKGVNPYDFKGYII